MVRPLHLGRSSEGVPVAEAALEAGDPAALIGAARQRGAELLWVHTNADLSAFGFGAASGYRRLHADVAPAGEPLPTLPDGDYAKTLDAAYRGLWGHKHVPADAQPPERAVVLGLYEGPDPKGLCSIFPEDRLIDGPGVVRDVRTPENYARLLLAACALLGSGPIDVDTWGDDTAVIDAYVEHGFAIVDEVCGWELQLC